MRTGDLGIPLNPEDRFGLRLEWLATALASYAYATILQQNYHPTEIGIEIQNYHFGVLWVMYREAKSDEILIFVCLQKVDKQCCDTIRLNCTQRSVR